MKELIETTEKHKLIEIGDGYFAKEQRSNYTGVSQRWILIFSQAAYKRESRTLRKNFLKGGQKEQKELWHLKNQEFSCRKDAEKALKRFSSKLKYTQLIDSHFIEQKKYIPIQPEGTGFIT